MGVYGGKLNTISESTRTEKRLLIVVDTDKGGARSNKASHRTLAEEEPLEHGKKCLTRRVQEVKRVAGLAAKADWAG